jgi:uncharacterized protein YjbK
MQHSLKFVLNDSTSYARVAAAFPESTTNKKALMLHEDSFLDTEDRLLSSNNIMLRVRRLVATGSSTTTGGANNGGEKKQHPPVIAEVRAMQHSTVTDGCAQRWDTAASLDPRVAEKIFLLPGNEPVVFGQLLDQLLASCGAFLSKIIRSTAAASSPPSSPGAGSSELQNRLSSQAAAESNFTNKKFIKLGGYRTLRDVRPWTDCHAQPGLELRLDHTTYSFGERYEVEVADISVPVQDVVDELGERLDKLGARYSLGHETKWQVLMAAKDSAKVKNKMAVAAKVELQTAGDFATVRTSLGGLPPDSENDEPFGELQENYFFDTADHALRRRNIVFRLRVLPQKNKAFVTIKENEPVTGGSAVSWLQEEAIPVEVVEATIKDPLAFFLHPSSAAEKIQTMLMPSNDVNSLSQRSQSKLQQSQKSQDQQQEDSENVNPPPSTPQKAKPGACVPSQDNFPPLVFVGYYRNRRESFVWPGCECQPGLTINLDRTKYPFGERFEVEVPGITVPVHDVVGELEQILTRLDVRFRPSTADKMQILLNGVNQSRASGIPPQLYGLNAGNLHPSSSHQQQQHNRQQTSRNNYYNGPQRILDPVAGVRRDRNEGGEEGDLF